MIGAKIVYSDNGQNIWVVYKVNKSGDQLILYQGSKVEAMTVLLGVISANKQLKAKMAH